MTAPEVILADEPTGAFDSRTARDVLHLLRESVAELGQTVVMVTHDPVAAAYADAVVFLVDGRTAGLVPAGNGVRARGDEPADRPRHWLWGVPSGMTTLALLS